MIYAHQIPVVGIGGALKPVLKPCAEVGVEDLHPDEVVVGVHVNGEARAYPVRIMNYHEVINDTLGGKPIVVAWSAFGNAAAAMLRAPDAAGKPREFGSAALILQSAIVLYDLETESLWWPVSRLCVAGKLVGERATPVQTGILPFKSWKLRYPETTVMMGVEPDLKIDYSRSMAVPPEYYRSGIILYPVYGLDMETSPLGPKAMIFGVLGADGKSARAYDFRMLWEMADDAFPLQDTLGGQPVTVTRDKERAEVLVKTADGKDLMVEPMFWMTWIGAHPKTEVWRQAELAEALKKRLEATQQADEAASQKTGLLSTDQPQP